MESHGDLAATTGQKCTVNVDPKKWNMEGGESVGAASSSKVRNRRDNTNTSWKKVKVLVAQSCLTFWNPMDCSPPGSPVHEILQARILEWVAISFSRGFSLPRDRTWISCIAGRFFSIWVTGEPIKNWWIETCRISIILKNTNINTGRTKIIICQTLWKRIYIYIHTHIYCC